MVGGESKLLSKMPSDNATAVAIRRLLACLIGMTLVALTLGAPAKANDPHTIAHWVSPVAANQHHHHDEAGAVVVEVHDHEQAPLDDDAKGGHEHMPTPTHGGVAVAADGPQFAAPVAASMPATVLPTAEPPNLTLPPHNRPPRFG